MKYYMGHFVSTWKGESDKFKVKTGPWHTKLAANKSKKEAYVRYPSHLDNCPRYRVVSDKDLSTFDEKRHQRSSVKRKEAAIANGEKRKEENARYAKDHPGETLTQLNFILCPSCKARSKKLYSEMGGLQTRVCKNGHRFEYDKWIADRSFWAGLDLTPGRTQKPLTLDRMVAIAKAPYKIL